jgi:HPt (histidine-containing phosphotransfer) domain-containing protein
MSTAEELQKKLNEVWQKVLPLMLTRLEAIERAQRELQAAKLTDDLRLDAAQQAHKLAGSLGVFGMQEASELAAKIEQLLSREAILNEESSAQLTDCVGRLKSSIESR